MILACTWQPRGELSRLQRLLPQLRQAYSGMAFALPPEADSQLLLLMESLVGRTVIVPGDWSHGRHAALQKALEHAGEAIHYADLDRLLHWVEAWPEEWQEVLTVIPRTDCLLLGRTARAWGTHPLAMQETERSINDTFSHLLGRPVDLGAGSRGFSRAAAMFLLTNSPPGNAPGTDAEWPVLLQRAGFAIDYRAVEGLEWESADQPWGRPADDETRRRVAAAYDQDLGHWLQRTKLALEIIQAGVAATRRQLQGDAAYWREVARQGI